MHYVNANILKQEKHSHNGSKKKNVEFFLILLFRVRKVFHTDLSDVSLGMHAMPNVRYEDYHSPDKQNVDALVLNPIPFDVDYLQNGQVVKVRDDALMANVRLWSASGFLSYIEGERIKKRK